MNTVVMAYRRGRIGARLTGAARVAVVAIALAGLPAAGHAAGNAGAPDSGLEAPSQAMERGTDRTAEGTRVYLLETPTPALTPGLPPPQFTTVSDRRIISGGILLLLAGFGALTALMWRELGMRINSD